MLSGVAGTLKGSWAMTPQRVGALVLIVAGIALFVVGVSSSDSVADQVSETFTGRFTKGTMLYLIGGGAMVLGGGMMLAMGRGKK
jgi:hypothetical protein